MIKQNTKEWHEFRKNHLGASDAPVVMQVSPWKTPYQLWQEKLGKGTDQKDNLAMQYGREHEVEARRCYEKVVKVAMIPKVVKHPSIDFMMSSLDGLSFDGKQAVEIKCAGEKDHQLAKEGKIPEKYFPQLQHQLACLGLSKMHYFSWRVDHYVLVEVSRSEEYIQTLCKEEKDFWEKVRSLEAPDLSDKDLREQTEDWEKEAEELYKMQLECARLTQACKERKQRLIESCDFLPSFSGKYQLKNSLRKGNVQYAKIPQLFGLDLDQYRGEMIESWRLTKVK